MIKAMIFEFLKMKFAGDIHHFTFQNIAYLFVTDYPLSSQTC